MRKLVFCVMVVEYSLIVTYMATNLAHSVSGISRKIFQDWP